jgi:hypothetical protein
VNQNSYIVSGLLAWKFSPETVKTSKNALRCSIYRYTADQWDARRMMKAYKAGEETLRRLRYINTHSNHFLPLLSAQCLVVNLSWPILVSWALTEFLHGSSFFVIPQQDTGPLWGIPQTENGLMKAYKAGEETLRRLRYINTHSNHFLPLLSAQCLALTEFLHGSSFFVIPQQDTGPLWGIPQTENGFQGSTDPVAGWRKKTSRARTLSRLKTPRSAMKGWPLSPERRLTCQLCSRAMRHSRLVADGCFIQPLANLVGLPLTVPSRAEEDSSNIT